MFLQKSSDIVADNNKNIKATLLRWSRFVKIINGFKPLTIFVKKPHHRVMSLWCLYYQLRTDFTHYSCVFFTVFEQVIADWAEIVKNKIY